VGQRTRTPPTAYVRSCCCRRAPMAADYVCRRVTNRLHRRGSRFIHGRGASHRPFFQSFFCSYPLHSRRWHTPARTATEANDQVRAHTLAQTGPQRTRKNTKCARTRAVSGTGRSRPPRHGAVYTPLSLSLHSSRALGAAAPAQALHLRTLLHAPFLHRQ
jgi:hypothetical protein